MIFGDSFFSDYVFRRLSVYFEKYIQHVGNFELSLLVFDSFKGQVVSSVKCIVRNWKTIDAFSPFRARCSNEQLKISFGGCRADTAGRRDANRPRTHALGDRRAQFKYAVVCQNFVTMALTSGSSPKWLWIVDWWTYSQVRNVSEHGSRNLQIFGMQWNLKQNSIRLCNPRTSVKIWRAKKSQEMNISKMSGEFQKNFKKSVFHSTKN